MTDVTTEARTPHICRRYYVASAQDQQVHDQCLAALFGGRETRPALVSCVSRKIQEGAYENELKLHIAADRLLDELFAT